MTLLKELLNEQDVETNKWLPKEGLTNINKLAKEAAAVFVRMSVETHRNMMKDDPDMLVDSVEGEMIRDVAIDLLEDMFVTESIDEIKKLTKNIKEIKK